LFGFFALLLLSGSLRAQQDPLFTQYIYNKLAFNPGYAGSGERFSVDLLSRFQWTGIKGAPRTISFTAHTPLRNQHIGVGLYSYLDELGPSVDYGAMAAFSYRLLFPHSTFAFGVMAGFKYMDINWGMLNPKDPGDILLTSKVTNRAVPDIDFGIYYAREHFYAGLSAKHLLQNQIVVSTTAPDNENNFTKLLRNFFAIAGGVVPLTESLVLMPSVLIKYVRNAPIQADLTACLLIRQLLTLGVTYRTASALGLIAQVNVGKGFTVGYSYDIWFNSLKSYNSGSHELRIGYEFGLFGKERMLSPRFF
jgi:type IX secretion system PorP/SprF family membrane protein